MTRSLTLALIGIGSLLCSAGGLGANVWRPAAPPAFPAMPSQPEDGRLTLATERVVIFKDGYALIVKTATGTPTPDGRLVTGEAPDAAVLGCFWATADGAAIRAMKAEWVESSEERTRETPCMNVRELLRANEGKPVRLGLASKEDAFITGTIVQVLEHTPAPPAHSWANPDAEAEDRRMRLSWGARAADLPLIPEARGEVVREIVPLGGDLVVIDLEDKTRLAYPVAQIRSVSGADLTTRTTRSERVFTRSKQLTFHVASLAGGETPSSVTMRLFYFTPGIRWIPTYRVHTSEATPSEAALSLQAEILNELEDIAGAKVDLVVGVPSFKFKNVISPMSLERELRSALVAAAPQLMGRQMASSMFAQRASEYTTTHAPADAAGDSALNLAPELASGGSGEQDLFVYTLDRFDLKKGARATIPMWESKAPMRHVYTLDLVMVRDRNYGDQPEHYVAAFDNGRERRQIPPDSPLRLADGRVWHQLELTNASSAPWTTGAALLLRGMLPLGQDMLTYTPVKGCTLLPVTVAMDVQSSYKEEELDRVPNAVVWHGNAYARVKKRATITLSSFRSVNSDVRIRLSTGGKVTAASDGGEVKINDYNPADWGEHRLDYRMNNHSDVSWNLTLEPGQTRTLTLEFEMYVR